MVAAVMTGTKKLSTGGARRADSPLSNGVREGVNGSGRVQCDTHRDSRRSSRWVSRCDWAKNPGNTRNGHPCRHAVTYPQLGHET